jgi:hypothetical protein
MAQVKSQGSGVSKATPRIAVTRVKATRQCRECGGGCGRRLVVCGRCWERLALPSGAMKIDDYTKAQRDAKEGRLSQALMRQLRVPNPQGGGLIRGNNNQQTLSIRGAVREVLREGGRG